jgi:8-oxo-dGTP pyrophosphatase MutT (NUDIX family)
MTDLSWRSDNVDISIKIKKSYGIILCKLNSVSHCPEVLLVHKRYTYYYNMFVHGKYFKPNIWPKSSMQPIITLLSQMTLEELLDVWSLDFKQMWYRIWINNNYDDDLYKRKYNKFYLSFIKYDNGDALRKCIQQIRNYNTLSWEVPKGRPSDAHESNILCAIREVKEETGLKKTDYFILPNVKRCVNYVSMGTRYICTYYIAIINPGFKYYNNSILKNINNVSEVSEVKWFDIHKIRNIDDSKNHLESLILPAFKLVKKYLQGKWITRYKNILPIKGD